MTTPDPKPAAGTGGAAERACATCAHLFRREDYILEGKKKIMQSRTWFCTRYPKWINLGNISDYENRVINHWCGEYDHAGF